MFGLNALDRKFMPKNIKFSALYKHGASGEITPAAKQEIMNTLEKSGLDKDRINKIVYNDQPVLVAEMKKIADHLYTNKISGFSKTGGLVDEFIRHEAIKARSIDARKHDYMLESMQEGTTSKQPGIVERITSIGGDRTKKVTSYGEFISKHTSEQVDKMSGKTIMPQSAPSNVNRPRPGF